MLTKLCPLCHEQVPLSLFEKHVFRERATIRRMKEDHPEWVETDGACHQCLGEYKKIHDQLLHEARRLRLARGEYFNPVDEDFEEEYQQYVLKNEMMNIEEEEKESAEPER